MRTHERSYSFWSALEGRIRVLSALSHRHVIARYGRENIGFLWLIIEPMILTLGVMILWSVLGRDKDVLPVVPFVLTGYALITLWRHVTNSCILFAERSSGLLYHRQVTLISIYLSRIFVEFIGNTMAVILLYAFVWILGLTDPIHDFVTLAWAWVFMTLLSMGVAGLIAAGTEYSTSLERFIPPLQYFILPISGCFFLVDWLPPMHRDVVLAFPIVHAFEMFREGYFGNAVVTHYSVGYLAVSSLLLNAAGFWAVHRAQDFAHIR